MECKYLKLKDLAIGTRYKTCEGHRCMVVGNKGIGRKLFVNVDSGWTSFSEDPSTWDEGVLCDENWNPLPEPKKTYCIGTVFRLKRRGETYMLTCAGGCSLVPTIVLTALKGEDAGRLKACIGTSCTTATQVESFDHVPASVIDSYLGVGEWEPVV